MSTIPDWNSHGVLPPYILFLPSTMAARSPYIVPLSDVVLRFCQTTARIEILKGFLQYRQELHSIGIIAGFQWLDGSFLEDAERIRNAAPKDIDVTTFFHLPAGTTEKEMAANHRHLFVPSELKRLYHTDGYTICLNPSNLRFCIQQSHYWYGVWSHQRDTLRWKGFVQIDLDPQNDSIAGRILENQKMIVEGDKT